MCETKIDLSHQMCTMILTSNQHMCCCFFSFIHVLLNVRRLNRMCHNRQWHGIACCTISCEFLACRYRACSAFSMYSDVYYENRKIEKKQTFVLSSMQIPNKPRQNYKVKKNALLRFFSGKCQSLFFGG